MRLLPKDSEEGWVPYAWLVYLAFFLAYPVLAGGWRTWALTIVCISAFLPLYFWGYWLDGKKVLIPMAGIAAIGMLTAKWNPGSSVFFVYAAAFVGEIGEPSAGLPYLGAIIALAGGEAWLLGLSVNFWIPAILFAALIGGVDMHAAQKRRMNRRLRMANEEIEHLAKVAERERIARDLHDLLGHTLSVIILKSELASKLAEKDPSRAATEIREVERISREALAEVRQAVKGYRSEGLASEMKRARDTLTTAGIQVEASAEPVPLAPAQESVLVLALREAVTNVVRHAQARTCRIRFGRGPSCCELEIADDGRGGASTEGTGLTGMRERVETLGGAIVRDSERGTRILIRLPLPEAA
ncbi:MAG TPA: sensor histidine kinase [Bryobacteraceae bacterium]|nr:sensor histidine kinase [Bryobacteraceae bacterium]